MGLLDDAIREHLELKRRRGADPDEVAREQREVLDSPAGANSLAEETAEDDASPEVSGAPLIDPTGEAPVAESAIEAVPTAGDLHTAASPDASVAERVSGSSPTPSALGSAGMGETAELDMASVLGEDAEHEPAEVQRTAPGPDDADALDWEMPGDDAEHVDSADVDEDVLEETPDFLRETPEQERLWFEQRPPRDFDFDK
ncbi:MAG TPA: hypothetical protein VMB05_10705 [Solirubrobacteraceae bacterium]|nr:hypothetical protein [Solirubrobacteraceae bacterium]